MKNGSHKIYLSEVLTVNAVAGKVGKTPDYIRKLTHEIPEHMAIQNGAIWLFHPDVVEWFENRPDGRKNRKS